jgi:hypothetical protein
MQRELAHEHGDVEKRAAPAQIPQAALVRCPAQALDVDLEVKRRRMHVTNAHGSGSDAKGMDGSRRHASGFATRRITGATDPVRASYTIRLVA